MFIHDHNYDTATFIRRNVILFLRCFCICGRCPGLFLLQIYPQSYVPTCKLALVIWVPWKPWNHVRDIHEYPFDTSVMCGFFQSLRRVLLGTLWSQGIQDNDIHVYALEVQPPFFIGWLPNHHYFSRDLSSSKRNHHFFHGGWLPGDA